MQKMMMLLLGLATLGGCQALKADKQQAYSRQQVYSQTISSTQGVVTAAHPLAMRAGVEMLTQGGNAVDAAVAAAFALAVVEPSMSGLGGRLQAIVRLPGGQISGVDATTQAPLSYQAATAPKAAAGYATIGIPGQVAGLTWLLEKYGTLPLPVVMAPAIRYAEKGFALLAGEAQRQASEQQGIRQYAGSRHYFLKGDTATYRAGEWFVQQDLARTLKKIAQGGRDAFYKGDIARRMIADLQAHGGQLSLADLAGYEVKESTVLQSSYRGFDVHALSMPSYGAITLEILNILENLPLGELTEREWAAKVYQAMDLGYQDRKKQSPDSIAVLISKAYAKKQAARLALAPGSSGWQRGPASSLPPSWTAAQGHTTHLSTADKSGMMVALTQSLGPTMGSQVATKGLGFLYATTLGGYLGDFKPGERASSHISPVIVTQAGQPFMALGAAGGAMIPTAVVSVISRVIDHKLPLSQALAAPRVHPGNDTILMELNTGLGWQAETVQAVKARGFRVKEIGRPARFGRVHAILYDPKTKLLTGAADPDWEGAAGAPAEKADPGNK